MENETRHRNSSMAVGYIQGMENLSSIALSTVFVPHLRQN